MDPIALIMRWTHIFCAGMAIGAPLFMRFVLMPAAQSALEDETHKSLRAAIMKRWRIWVYVLIALFLISGSYTYYFAVMAHWDVPAYYHMLFGMKFLAVLFLFFLASALAGRSKALEFIRLHSVHWMNIYVGVIIFVIAISGVLRLIRDHYPRH